MRRLTLLLTGLLLSACSLPFAGGPSEDVSLPPTPTTIGVALPPAWTATPPAQTTSAPRRPTPSAVEPSPTPAIEVSALRLAELPAQYTPAQPISYGLVPAALSAGVLQTQALALFEDLNTGTLVISVASLLASPAEEQAVLQGLESPTTLVEVLAGALGQLEAAPRALDGYGDIGTASAAAEGRILYRSFRYDLRIVLFRQGPIAAYVGVLVPLGANAGFELGDLARQHAARLQLATIIDAPTIPAP